MSDDPEFVDAFQGASVADLDWHRRQQLNGDGGSEAPAPNSWIPRRLASVPDEPAEEPTLGGLGLVYPGKRHVFSGPQESAKTIAAYIVALSVVREGEQVVLIDFEMGSIDTKRRFSELGATTQELDRILYVEPEVEAKRSDIDALIELDPALVVVDASAGAFVLQGLDDNARKDVEQWAQLWIDPFRRAGIASIIVDHVTKNVETRGNYAIGSERKVGQTDVHLGFQTAVPMKRGGDGHYKIVTHKDRPGFHKRGLLMHMHLRSHPETHAIEWAFEQPAEGEEAERRLTGYMEKVSRWLEHQSEQVTMTEIKKAGLGKDEYVVSAVRTLVAEEYVEQVAGKQGAQLTRSLKPYREEDDPGVFNPFPTRSREWEQVDDQTRSPFPLYRERDGTASDGHGNGSEQEIPF